MKKLLLSLCTICILGFILTGCGQSTNNGSTSGNNDPNLGNNTTEDTNNVVDDIGDAAMDVVDGVGNAVDDLVGGNGFDNYNDAHDYFLKTMGDYHTDANFQLRNENKNLTDYQEGSKGYHFTLYDTSNNTEGELFGEFYVDATSGFIYKKGEDGTIVEYPANNQSTTGNTSSQNTSKNDPTNNTNNSSNKKSNNNTNNNSTNNSNNNTPASRSNSSANQ